MAARDNWPTPSGAMNAGYTRDGEKRAGRTSTGNRRGHQGNELLRRVEKYPTPCVPNGGRSPKGGMSRTGRTADGKKRQVGLEQVVTGKGLYPTPTVGDSRSSGMRDPEKTGCHSGTSLTDSVVRYPTPRATDGSKGSPNSRGSKGDLSLPAVAARYPTPTVQDSANTGGPSQHKRNTPPLNAIVTLPPGHISLEESNARAAEVGRRLNPRWVEWLMGWPIGWTSLEPLDHHAFDRWYGHTTLDGCESPSWWLADPSMVADEHGAAYDVTRTVTKCLHRVDQLKALGNGQVPRVADEAWRSMISP